MGTGAAANWALRHDKLLVAGGLFGVALASWAYLLSGAGMMQDMGGMVMPMSEGPWTLAHAALMLAMWAVMMVAMMLPSAAPMILLYERIASRSAAPAAAAMRTAAFAAGYLAAWTAFSIAAVALQYGLEQAALLSPMMQTTSVALAAATLIAAGIYQWTPFKQSCLRHCRSPVEFLSAHWRNGAPGALRMGWRHGVYCLGCCWVLMLLLFVGGVMSLTWIAGLALFVLVEKLAPAGHWLSRCAGLLLIAWGSASLYPLLR